MSRISKDVNLRPDQLDDRASSLLIEHRAITIAKPKIEMLANEIQLPCTIHVSIYKFRDQWEANVTALFTSKSKQVHFSLEFDVYYQLESSIWTEDAYELHVYSTCRKHPDLGEWCHDEYNISEDGFAEAVDRFVAMFNEYQEKLELLEAKKKQEKVVAEVKTEGESEIDGVYDMEVMERRLEATDNNL